jgi:hypothetical protein
MKFTLMTDDVWSGKKITFEFDEDTLPKILENFELFLKANGFEFDGYLDFTIPEIEPESDWPQFDDEKPVEQCLEGVPKVESCSVCGINKNIMFHHQCFHKKCPKDTW